MKLLLLFNEFVNESYLSGSRAPIYKYVSDYTLGLIMESDSLKMGKPARDPKGMAVCFTRNPNFTHDGHCYVMPRLVLDSDKLRNSGYKIHPVDELGLGMSMLNRKLDKRWKNDDNYTKSNFPNFKKGVRYTKHNLDLPKSGTMEIEFEERIYKNIPNLGNYIISIDFEKSNIDSNPGIAGKIGKYLDKYPHIIINSYDKDNRSKTINITDEVLDIYKNKWDFNWIK